MGIYTRNGIINPSRGASSSAVVLSSSAIPIATTSTGAETIVAKTITIPGGTLKVGDIFRIIGFWTCDDNANVKRIYIDINDSAQRIGTFLMTSQSSIQRFISVGIEAANTAHWFDNNDPEGWGFDSNAVQSGTVDISADINIVISHQFAASGDTTTLKHYVVELIRGK